MGNMINMIENEQFKKCTIDMNRMVLYVRASVTCLTVDFDFL